jgi:hypothetical protein
MGKYGVDAKDHTTSTALLGAIGLVGAAGERAEVVELIMTGSGVTAAADTQHSARAAKLDGTTAGTKTDATPEKFNEASAVATLLASTLYTVQPTNVNTVYPVLFGFNQRGGMRWAVPKGEGIEVNGDESENALIWQVISSAAGKVDANAHWWEP